jgi:hypothetical protein
VPAPGRRLVDIRQTAPGGMWFTSAMKLFRRLRVFAAFLALATLAVAQAGLAAYVCTGDAPMARAMAMAQGDREMDCCGDAAADPQAALCDAHCQQGDRSLDKPPAPVLSALAAETPAVPAVAAPYPSPPPGILPSLLARATAPSVAVRHCCFRI